MLRRVLIANRGEIALRVLRACREMGIETVAACSEADREALHVQLATQAVCVGPARAADSYLNQEALLTAALATGCDGVHPGYGFLSENAEFADACAEAGLTFIGSREAPCRDGEEKLVTIGGQRYYVRYKLISGEDSGVGTLITTSAASKILQEERRIRKSLVQKGPSAKYTFRSIIAVNPEMRKKVEIAKKFSRADSDVLITGETGTGKELFAHSIHSASGRMSQPFVAINCATLPENLLESELFGYEPGSFSGASREGRMGLFELAHRGTIFLDEIGEIPVALQAKLLRVLQEKEIRRIGSASVIPIDVRVIAATNVNIREQIALGKFRSDLLYRLNALEISIPPLRERPDDVIPLMEGQLRILAAGLGKQVPKLTPEAQKLLCRYAWPGNVRELRNICERLVVLSDAADVTVEDLNELHSFSGGTPAHQPDSDPPSAPPASFPAKTKTELARELGVSRTTLWRMSKRQGGQK